MKITELTIDVGSLAARVNRERLATIRADYRNMVLALGAAEFACGEWPDGDDGDEPPYEELCARASARGSELVDAIEFLLALIPAPSDTAPRTEA